MRNSCILSWSSSIDRDHSDSVLVVIRIRLIDGVAQHGSVPIYRNCFALSTDYVGDGNIVAQDGCLFQSEGRTPGDTDSIGVDGI